MNFKAIKYLFKKELLDVLRDKKTVIMMLVVPLILYPLIFVAVFLGMSKISTTMEEKTYKIGYSDLEEDLLEQFEAAVDGSEEKKGYSTELIKSDDLENDLRNGKLDIYIIETNENGKRTYSIHYISSVTNSNYAEGIVRETLNDYKLLVTTKILESANMEPDEVLNPIKISQVDMATSEESAGNLLGSIIPFMLIISLLMGTMYPAIDTTAGEKERGTLETILTLPVSNKELIISKFLTVALIGIVSALLNIISMVGIGAYIFNMASNVSNSDIAINLKQFVPAVIVGILCIFSFSVFISAITMCFSAFAKSYKEANNYITPLMLVILCASYIGFIPNVVLTQNMALVPVANICLLIRDMLAFKYDLMIILIVLVSNIAYGILAILVLSKIYSSEAILFSDGSTEIQFFERRSNMKKGGVPSLGDVWMLIAIMAVAIIYIGGAIGIKSSIGSIVGTQAMILGLPLLAVLYTKKDIKKTFSMRGFSIKMIFSSVIMMIGAIMVGLVLTGISSGVFKSAQSSNDLLSQVFGNNFLVALMLIAVLPAICEEMMFRGYIFSSFAKKMKPYNAIILSSLIFGIYHMSAISFLTTTFLGMIICFVTYKSKSIFPGMIMHFINNALSCTVMFYPEKIGKIFPVLLSDSVSIPKMIIILLVGAAFIIIGGYLTKVVTKESK